MKTKSLLIFICAMALIPGALHAYSLQSVNSLLAGYDVPNSLINNLRVVNVTHAGNAYAALYKGNALYFVINVTNSDYRVVLNSTSLYEIMRNYTLNATFLQIDFAALAAQMHRYQASSASSLNDCLIETGLDTGNTCTLSNYCQSCQFIPVCKTVMDKTSGPNGVLGLGIMKFEIQYDWLNASFNKFYSSISGISKSNVVARLAVINSAFLNVSNISQLIYQNTIFPPTANVTPNLLAQCIYYSSSTTAPWYCTSLGYCGNLNYNYTKLSLIRNMLNNINSMPLSDAQISLFAANTTRTENIYIISVLSVQKLAELNQILNTTLLNYGATVNNTRRLLGHVTNSTLLEALTKLEATYADVIRNYITMNLTLQNRTLAIESANLSGVYNKINATYSSILSRAAGNTAKLLELQLKSTGASQDVGAISFEDFRLNSVITANDLGDIGNLTVLSNEVDALSSRLSKYSVSAFSMIEFARAVDGPFIRALAPALRLNYQAAVSLAPVLGALFSLIIGVLAFLALILIRSYLRLHHKVVINKKTSKNWKLLFAWFWTFVLIYVIFTYVLLVHANSFAPFSAFRNAYDSSKSVVIAINGTSATSEYACASKMSAQALSMNKRPVVASFSNGVCTIGNSTRSVDSCMSMYSSTNVPVIVLTNSIAPGISVYSLYGTDLFVSGNDTLMNSCYVSFLTR